LELLSTVSVNTSYRDCVSDPRPSLENAVSGDSTFSPFTSFPSTHFHLESAQTPGGIRLGTSALTSRDMVEADVRKVADFLHRAVQLTTTLQKESGSKLVKDLLKVAEEGKSEGSKAIKQLRKEVSEFAQRWPLPGIDAKSLKRPEGIPEDF
jgi:hypothetical protein